MAKLEPLWLHLHAIAERMGEAGTLSVATDYDGTITPIVSHPGEVELPGRAKRALERLSGVAGVRVMVLSGRSLEDLRKQIGVRGLSLGGNAGLESEDEQGQREVHVPPGKEVPASLRSELETWCQRFPGAWLEDKGHSIALHYRNVPQRFQGAFGAGVRRRARPHRGAASLVHGKKVFEVMPAISWNKADALEAGGISAACCSSSGTTPTTSRCTRAWWKRAASRSRSDAWCRRPASRCADPTR